MDQHSPGIVLRDHASIPAPDPREAGAEVLRILGETLDGQREAWDALHLLRSQAMDLITGLQGQVRRLAETVNAQRGEIADLRARVESQELRLYLQGEILARHVTPRPGPKFGGPNLD